jgi:hypothetical protein
MSCHLSFIGEDLDVDILIERVGIPGFRKSYKGELFSPIRNLYSRTSSASIQIGNADFSNFGQQVKDAEEFLLLHSINLKVVSEIDGIQYATITFGSDSTSLNEKSVQSFYFPIELISICAELRISIETSVYNSNHFSRLGREK